MQYDTLRYLRSDAHKKPVPSSSRMSLLAVVGIFSVSVATIKAMQACNPKVVDAKRDVPKI